VGDFQETEDLIVPPPRACPIASPRIPSASASEAPRREGDRSGENKHVTSLGAASASLPSPSFDGGNNLAVLASTTSSDGR